MGLRPLIEWVDVSESDRVVHFELVLVEVSPLGKLGENFHAYRFGLFVEFGLAMLVFLHFHKVFPLALAELRIDPDYATLFIKKAIAH